MKARTRQNKSLLPISVKITPALRKALVPLDSAPISLSQWLKRVQQLIQAYSTPPRKAGKYKGHSSTDTRKWIEQLAWEVERDIRRCNKGKDYDENMALAQTLGTILFVWYASVQRAKAYDPNRPLELRRKAFVKRREKIALLMDAIHDDELMTEVFSGQFWNLPYGKNAHGGDFV